jgi:flagellar motor protein MotB
MAKIVRPYNHLNEDENNNQIQQNNNQQQQQQQQTVNQSTQTVNYTQQLAQLQREIDAKEKEFNDFKALKQELMNKIRMEAAKNGVDLTKNEGVSYRFSKKLYESLQSSKAEELAAAVKNTFDNLDTLSYYMDNKGCTTFARRLLAWLNEQNWNDGKDHWDDVEEKIRMLLSGGNISMSRREISEFSTEFQNVLRNNTVFGWIFGIR